MGLGCYLVQLSYLMYQYQKYLKMGVNDKCALMKPIFTGRSLLLLTFPTIEKTHIFLKQKGG